MLGIFTNSLQPSVDLHGPKTIGSSTATATATVGSIDLEMLGKEGMAQRREAQGQITPSGISRERSWGIVWCGVWMWIVENGDVETI